MKGWDLDMGWGIRDKRSKKWISSTYESSDGTARCRLTDDSYGGIWVRSKDDAKEFMKEHLLKDTRYEPYSYNIDFREKFFKEREHYLLQKGWYVDGNHVYRPDGSRYY